MKKDINTGKVIRKTDNSVKDGDSYILDHQVNRPLNDSEIKEAIHKAKGGKQ